MSDKIVRIFDTALSQPEGLLLQALAGVWGVNNGITYLGRLSVGLLFDTKTFESADVKRLVMLFGDTIDYKVLEAGESLELNTNVKAAIVLANEV